jgi:hypothetical protein
MLGDGLGDIRAARLEHDEKFRSEVVHPAERDYPGLIRAPFPGLIYRYYGLYNDIKKHSIQHALN